LLKDAMAHPDSWLVKSEPSAYGWADLGKDGRTEWTGVRNFEARNNLRAMHEGDGVLFYHSGEGKEVVGVAKVSRAARPDDTAPNEDWASVELVPWKALASPVSLGRIRKDARLRTFQLLTRGRLSVVPVSKAHFEAVLSLSKAAPRPPRAAKGGARGRPR
jgi:predicted RNA-binding protein with PUA-like domain